MMFWYGSGLAFWEAALMWVGMIAFWGLLIWAVYALFTRSAGRAAQGHREQHVRHILDERLARGEIDAGEYQRLRDLIGPEHQARRAPGADDDHCCPPGPRAPPGSGGLGSTARAAPRTRLRLGKDDYMTRLRKIEGQVRG